MLNLKAMRAQRQNLGHHYPLGLNHHPSQLNSRELANKKTLASLNISNFYPSGFPLISQQVESSSIEQNDRVQKSLDNTTKAPSSQQQRNQYPKHSQVGNSDSAHTFSPYESAAHQFEVQNNFEKSSNAYSNIVVPPDNQSVQRSNLPKSSQRENSESTQNNQISNLYTVQESTSFREKIQQYFSDNNKSLQDSGQASLETLNLSKANPPCTDAWQKSSTEEVIPFFTSSQANLVKSTYQLNEYTQTAKNLPLEFSNNESLNQRPNLDQFPSLTSASSGIDKEKKNDIRRSLYLRSTSPGNLLNQKCTIVDKANLGFTPKKEEQLEFDSDLSKSSLAKTNKEQNTNDYKVVDPSVQTSSQRNIENYFQLENQSNISSSISISPESIASKELEDIQENPSSLAGRRYSKSTDELLDHTSTPISIQRNLETSEKNRKNHQLENSENRDTTQTLDYIRQNESVNSLVDNFSRLSNTVYSPSILESIDDSSIDMFLDSRQSSQLNLSTLDRYSSSSIQDFSFIQDNKDPNTDFVADHKNIYSSNYDFFVQHESNIQPLFEPSFVCRKRPLDVLGKTRLDEKSSKSKISLAKSSINYSFLPTQSIFRKKKTKDILPIKECDNRGLFDISNIFEMPKYNQTPLVKQTNDFSIENEGGITSQSRVSFQSNELTEQHPETLPRTSTNTGIRRILKESNSLQKSNLFPEPLEYRNEISAAKNPLIQDLSKLEYSYNEPSKENLPNSSKNKIFVEQRNYAVADTFLSPYLQPQRQRKKGEFSLQLSASTAISNIDENIVDGDKGSQKLVQSAIEPSTSKISPISQATDETQTNQLLRTLDSSEPTIHRSSIFTDFLNQSFDSVDTYQPYSSASTEPFLLAKVEGIKTDTLAQSPNASSVVSNNSKSDSVLNEKNTTLSEVKLHRQTLSSQNDEKKPVALNTLSYVEEHSEGKSQKTPTDFSQLISHVKDNIGNTTQRDLDTRESLSARNYSSNSTEEVLQELGLTRKDKSVIDQLSLINALQDHKIQKLEVTEGITNQESKQTNSVGIDSHSEESIMSSSKTPITLNTLIGIERAIEEPIHFHDSSLFIKPLKLADNREELGKKDSKHNDFNLSEGDLESNISDINLSITNLSKPTYSSISTELVLPLLSRKELYNQINFENEVAPGISPCLQSSFLQLTSRSSQLLSTPVDIALSDVSGVDRERSNQASLQLASKPMLSTNYALPVLQSKDKIETSQQLRSLNSSEPNTLFRKIEVKQKNRISKLSSQQIRENSVENSPNLLNPDFEETKQNFSQQNQLNKTSLIGPISLIPPQKSSELNAKKMKADQATNLTLLSSHIAQSETALPTLPSILKKSEHNQSISSSIDPISTSLILKNEIKYQKAIHNLSKQQLENVSSDNSDINSNTSAPSLSEGISLQNHISQIARQLAGNSLSPTSHTTTTPLLVPQLTMLMPTGQLNSVNQVEPVYKRQDATEVSSVEKISSLQNNSTNLSKNCDAGQEVSYKNEMPVQFSSLQAFVSQENNFFTPLFSKELPVELSNLQDFESQAVEISPSTLEATKPLQIQLDLEQDQSSLPIQLLSLTHQSMEGIQLAEANQSIKTSSTLPLSPASLHPLPPAVQPRLIDEESLGSKVNTPINRSDSVGVVDQVASVSKFGLSEKSSNFSQTKPKISKISKKAVQKNPLSPILLDTSLAQKPTTRKSKRSTPIQKQPTANILQPSSLQVASPSSQQLSIPVDIAVSDVSVVDRNIDNQTLLQLTSEPITGASYVLPALQTKNIIKTSQQLLPLDSSEPNTLLRKIEFDKRNKISKGGRHQIKNDSTKNSLISLNPAFEETRQNLSHKKELIDIASASLTSANSAQKFDGPYYQKLEAAQDLTLISLSSHGSQPKTTLSIFPSILQRSKNSESMYSSIDPIPTSLMPKDRIQHQKFSNNFSEQKLDNASSESYAISINAPSFSEGIPLQSQASKNIVAKLSPNLGLEKPKSIIQSDHFDLLRVNKKADVDHHQNLLDSHVKESSYQPLIPSLNQEHILKKESTNSELQQQVAFPQLSRAIEKIGILQTLVKPSLSGLSQSHLESPQNHQSKLISINDTEKLGEKTQSQGKNSINLSRSIAPSHPGIASKPLQKQAQNMNMSSSDELPVEWSNLQDFVLQASESSPSILEVKQPLQIQLDLEQDQASLPVQRSSLTHQSMEGVQSSEVNQPIKSLPIISFPTPSLDLSPFVIQPSPIDTEDLRSKAETLTDWSNLGSLIEQLASTSKSSLSEKLPLILQTQPQKMKVSKKTVQAKPLAPVLPNTSPVKRSTNSRNAKPNSIQKKPIENTLQTSVSPLQATASNDYVTISTNDEKKTLSTSQSIEMLAQEMYSLLKQRLNIEKERRGG